MPGPCVSWGFPLSLRCKSAARSALHWFQGCRGSGGHAGRGCAGPGGHVAAGRAPSWVSGSAAPALSSPTTSRRFSSAEKAAALGQERVTFFFPALPGKGAALVWAPQVTARLGAAGSGCRKPQQHSPGGTGQRATTALLAASRDTAIQLFLGLTSPRKRGFGQQSREGAEPRGPSPSWHGRERAAGTEPQPRVPTATCGNSKYNESDWAATGFAPFPLLHHLLVVFPPYPRGREGARAPRVRWDGDSAQPWGRFLQKQPEGEGRSNA